MFFDDIKTIYDLGAPESHQITIDQSYSDYRKGAKASLDSLSYLPMQDLKVTDLDTAKALTVTRSGGAASVALDVPITSDRQSAHLRLVGTIVDPGMDATRHHELTRIALTAFFDAHLKGDAGARCAIAKGIDAEQGDMTVRSR